MANTLSFDDALAEALSFLFELGMSRVLPPNKRKPFILLFMEAIY